MKYALVLVLAFDLSLQEPARHDKYADDAAAYCYNPATSGSRAAARARDPHAHSCTCHLVCTRDATGAVTGDQEDQSCELYCTRSHCTCHVEEACEGHH